VPSRGIIVRPKSQAKAAKEVGGGGANGQVALLPSAFSLGPLGQGDIRPRAHSEGGAVVDVGCYNVSWSRLIAGEPERVWGEAWYGPSGTDWVFTGTMRFPVDAIACFDCGTALTERDEVEIVGSEGSRFLDDPYHCVVPVTEA